MISLNSSQPGKGGRKKVGMLLTYLPWKSLPAAVTFSWVWAPDSLDFIKLSTGNIILTPISQRFACTCLWRIPALTQSTPAPRPRCFKVSLLVSCVLLVGDSESLATRLPALGHAAYKSASVTQEPSTKARSTVCGAPAVTHPSGMRAVLGPIAVEGMLLSHLCAASCPLGPCSKLLLSPAIHGAPGKELPGPLPVILSFQSQQPRELFFWAFHCPHQHFSTPKLNTSLTYARAPRSAVYQSVQANKQWQVTTPNGQSLCHSWTKARHPATCIKIKGNLFIH